MNLRHGGSAVIVALGMSWSMALAQPAAPLAQVTNSASSSSMQQERLRINAERERLTDAFATQEAACYQRFAVNRCLQKINRDLIDRLADLRRQELILNDQERRNRGAEQIRKLEEKASLPPPLPALAASGGTAPPASAVQAAAEAKKRTESLAIAAQKTQKNQQKQQARSAKQAAAAAEAQKYADRQAQAEQRRSRHAQEQAQRSKPAALSLPAPP